ncbi:unnamed protein product [Euphydryas editha]|uniref:Uncharacterized protein n=1 Tax=Euphydryas editha TaxID=104508 RepID=A0AAU9VAY3_EUPED|nr:unnamed protein product [Euphydryas editha]
MSTYSKCMSLKASRLRILLGQLSDRLLGETGGSLSVLAASDAARMGGAGWTREARVADDTDFETLKQLLDSDDGWNLEYEKDGVKVWAENAAHGALRTVKVCLYTSNTQ